MPLRRFKIAFAVLTALMCLSSPFYAQSPKLDEIKEKGALNCGISSNLRGFSEQVNGVWTGFDVDFCRAVSAAIFGDPDRVVFVPLTGTERFPALQKGEVDMLSRVTTETFTRDVDLKLSFAGVDYYDGQGFMVQRYSGITSTAGLRNAKVCVQRGTTTLLNLEEFSTINDLNITILATSTHEEAFTLYRGRSCDAYTSDASSLASALALSSDPNSSTLLPEIISKEPLSLVVAEGDDAFLDIVRWVLNATINAEELGVTSSNVYDLAADPDARPEIRRLLGTAGQTGSALGLSFDWAVEVIATVGNYGEIFSRHIGLSTPLRLRRNLNRQWYDGGLIFAPPFR